jgi:hypothetical protein
MTTTTSARLAPVGKSHPNRGGSRGIKAAANPTPAQIRRAREGAGLTLEQAGELVHTGWRTWQNWEAEEGTAEHRRMHSATWELFRVKMAARKLLEENSLSPAIVRALGLYFPDPEK